MILGSSRDMGVYIGVVYENKRVAASVGIS